jgi:hypothetical protein
MEKQLAFCDVQRHFALVENVPGDRDHSSAMLIKLIGITPESLIDIARNE